MVVEFVKGKTREYIAQIDFALNFDDRNIKSVKVKKGRAVKYDGEIASYFNDDGETVSGRCSSLKSAIVALNWLAPRPFKEESAEADAELFEGVEDTSAEAQTLVPAGDYDSLKGGNFESDGAKQDFAIAGKTKKREIILEEDLIVKEFPVKKEEVVQRPKQERLEVARDQAAVKEVGPISVTSSTVVTKEKKRSPKIIVADEMGADGTIPLKRKAASTDTGASDKKKKGFVVDDTTPRPMHDEMTLDEVRRVTKVINADESQDAQVVTKIDRTKIKVQQIDGITMRKPAKQSHDIKLNKVKSPQDMTITTTVGSGGGEVFDATTEEAEVVATVKKDEPVVDTPEVADTVETEVVDTAKTEVADTVVETDTPEVAEGVSDDGIAPPINVDDLLSDVVISPVTETSDEKPEVSSTEETVIPPKPSVKEAALKRAAQRKKASAATQKMVEDENPTPKKKTVKKVVKKKVVKKASDKTPAATPENSNYLSILPEDWSKLHWTKKEKFVMEQTDIDFIKYLLTTAPSKAVQNACKERLKQLGEEIPS